MKPSMNILFKNNQENSEVPSDLTIKINFR